MACNIPAIEMRQAEPADRAGLRCRPDTAHEVRARAACGMTAVLIFAMNLCSLCRDFFDRQRSTRIARQQRHAGLVMRHTTGRDAVEIKAQARFEIFATVTLLRHGSQWTQSKA